MNRGDEGILYRMTSDEFNDEKGFFYNIIVYKNELANNIIVNFPCKTDKIDVPYNYYNANLYCTFMDMNGSEDKYKNKECGCLQSTTISDELNVFKCYEQRNMPAYGYNGSDYIYCNCSDNIIRNLAQDWTYIYNLPNSTKYYIENVDDYGQYCSYEITTPTLDNDKFMVIFSNGFYGI